MGHKAYLFTCGMVLTLSLTLASPAQAKVRFSLGCLLVVVAAAGAVTEIGKHATRYAWKPIEQQTVRNQMANYALPELRRELAALTPEERDQEVFRIIRVSHEDPTSYTSAGNPITNLIYLASGDTQRVILARTLDDANTRRVETIEWHRMFDHSLNFGEADSTPRLRESVAAFSNELVLAVIQAKEAQRFDRFLGLSRALMDLPSQFWSPEALKHFRQVREDILAVSQTKKWNYLSEAAYFRSAAVSESPEEEMAKVFFALGTESWEELGWFKASNSGVFWMEGQAMREGLGLRPLDLNRLRAYLMETEHSKGLREYARVLSVLQMDRARGAPGAVDAFKAFEKLSEVDARIEKLFSDGSDFNFSEGALQHLWLDLARLVFDDLSAAAFQGLKEGDFGSSRAMLSRIHAIFSQPNFPWQQPKAQTLARDLAYFVEKLGEGPLTEIRANLAAGRDPTLNPAVLPETGYENWVADYLNLKRLIDR